jgi:EAL domain-containing protein (putative c-di-GMP-specific phosphodiesterase class I)
LDVGVAVNLSARQLMDPDLVDAVAAALAASGVPAGALMLEITENVLVDSSDDVPRTLHALRALGVRVALDDFGTGFSSLGYLGRLPVDTLKVDRTFVAALGSDVDAPVLLRTMVNLGNDLGLTVVAEGVETVAELRRCAAWATPARRASSWPGRCRPRTSRTRCAPASPRPAACWSSPSRIAGPLIAS